MLVDLLILLISLRAYKLLLNLVKLEMLKFNRLYKVSHFIFKLSGFIYSGQRLS